MDRDESGVDASRVRASACASHEASQPTPTEAFFGLPAGSLVPHEGPVRYERQEHTRLSPAQVDAAADRIERAVITSPRGSLGEDVTCWFADTCQAGCTQPCAAATPRRTDAERYGFVRTLSPYAFRALWDENIRTGRPFDLLVDAAMAAQRWVTA